MVDASSSSYHIYFYCTVSLGVMSNDSVFLHVVLLIFVMCLHGILFDSRIEHMYHMYSMHTELYIYIWMR